jgi:hypothetical protein
MVLLPLVPSRVAVVCADAPPSMTEQKATKTQIENRNDPLTMQVKKASELK